MSRYTRPNRIVVGIRSHPLTAFFVCSYAVSWLLWVPVVVLGLPPFSAERHAPAFYVLPGIAVGVTGTAFALTAVTQGRAGVRRLLQRLVSWRVGAQWWLVAIVLLPGAAMLVAAALGTPDIVVAFAPASLTAYPAAYIVHFVFGPLFEETGWRGFALPRMQHRFGALRGTFLLGVLWSAWHFFLYVPVWFATGFVDGVTGLAIFVVTTTALTFAFTWLTNNTRASLLLAILMHGSVDGTVTYLQDLAERGVISHEAADQAIGLGQTIACVLLAAVLLVVTRGRLSYPRYAREAEELDLHPGASATGTGDQPLTGAR
ncbi:lysostaphin resistance A-like protein [Pseudonocardia spirodelae]|uniref:Lysostaphin resistance A-like protein n=1 Tax=Pseudonocardia spirodelae TaxID=3133431 RepID=A0ABU8TAB0_9PSEU